MVPPHLTNQQTPVASTPQTTPAAPAAPVTPSSKPTKSGKAIVPIAITVGLLMLGAVGYLTYGSITATRALEQKVAEFEESERLRLELDSQYKQAIADLESMKGDNEQLNALIDQQKAELEQQKNQIGELLREKKQLDAARSELSKLKAKVAGYIAEIEQLKSEQEQLSLANVQLKTDKDSLQSTLQFKVAENESLNSARVQLVSEREELSKSVQLGSVVKVKEVKVEGVKLRKNGKTSEKESAKRIDQLKVCFTTVANDVVKPGTEKFFIRIISPKGETLAIDDLGSGTTVDSKTGEQVRYTQVQEYEYANDETQLCFNWKPNTPFQSGHYKVEIYNKGYLAGTGEVDLK